MRRLDCKRLREDIATEKRSRVGYQDILYKLCNIADSVVGERVTAGELVDVFRKVLTGNARLRAERDELIISMKEIVAIWEAGEGTFEEDGERMVSIAEEMSDKWGI